MTTQGRAETLTDTLLMMDVVDELRHRDAELKAQAEKGLDDAGLRRRLAEIYRSQGIEVSDTILDAGISAQRERRYVYVAPTGFRVWLARRWIDRRAIAKQLSIGAAAVFAAMVLFHVGWTMPREHFAGKRVTRLNTEAAVLMDDTKVAAVSLQRAKAALGAAAAKAAADGRADRLQPLATKLAADGRSHGQQAQSALDELARRLPLPLLVRADGETTAVRDGKALAGAGEDTLVGALAAANASLARATAATHRIRQTAVTLEAAIDTSRTLEAANAAALHAGLPRDADAIRVSSYAAGDSALRTGEIAKAQAAVHRIDTLAADVALLGTLASRLDTLHDEALATGVTGDDLATFEASLRKAQSLLSIATLGDAKDAAQEVERLVGLLSAEYAYRIVNRPGERSGLWRHSEDAPGTKNFYLVVEALGPNGQANELMIRNEETGATEKTVTFAVRVPEAEYNRVGEDKQDNGIIDSDVIGKKQRGRLQPAFDIPVAGGYITAW